MTDLNNAPHLTWAEPACPAVIEFSIAALERLRQEAVKGLEAIPRVGLGIGGFLTGTRAAGRIRVDNFVPVSCSHAKGPAFRLTPAEQEQALATAADFGPRIVGCYLSKTVPPLQPDQDLYDSFCPESWQIMLLIRPVAQTNTEEKSGTALVFRDPGGTVVQSAERELTKPADIPEPEDVPAEDTGFDAVRIFGLVPSSGKSTRRIVATPSPQAETTAAEDAPYGFHSVPGVRLSGKQGTPLPPRPVLPPQFSIPEESPAFEPIRTVRFAGQSKATVAGPLHPELEPRAEFEFNEPELPPEPPPVAMPEGPIEFEPVRRIMMSGRPPDAPVRTIPETALPSPEGPAGFEPARKSMFVGDEPVYTPRPVASVVERVEAPPISPFLEPEPERKQIPAMPLADLPEGDGPHGFSSVRSAAFMSQAEKHELRDAQTLATSAEKPAEPVVVKEPLSPEALARRKMILRGTGVLALLGVVYATRDAWLPAPFKLELTDSASHVTALWNAEILNPGDTGTLTVKDGGETRVIQLDASKVAGGVFGFDRKTPSVSATLNVGDKSVTATLQLSGTI